MTLPLPVGGFEVVYEDKVMGDKESVFKLLTDWTLEAEWGYIFEVDIDVPQSLHDKHNELPFLAERFNERLTPTLFNKTNYRTHVLVLKQALDHGLKLVHVHEVIKFRQKKWLKGYIEHNTRMRAATNVIYTYIIYIG